FIKIDDSNQKIEKVWEGEVLEISGKGDKVYFKVHLEREIEPNDDKYYSNYKKSGWYILEEPKERLDPLKLLEPLFFEELRETHDSKQFEEYGYYLLKLLGINQVYKYPRENQAGLPDGVFKIGSLVVVFDFTLHSDYLSKKTQQIDNYINLITKSSIIVPDNIEISTVNGKSEVWIITRSQNRLIKQQENIKAREVTIDFLIDVYHKRLKEIIGEEGLIKFLTSS
ncbi:MAG: hypothetical protein N2517_04410, partial [Ignavibacteria bacterium]|nr:hypothetical protein [Ignavibacteria bacterium]